ncbi:sigma-70 family RNA polymerase sigma factor [Amycolatopsis taiwanensis]|uniref:RNA polymerase subunit sigma n=1 Tax=Amycolatopsis taiwanensis TaxID=342230 RepID=A0A9W6R3D1_9PSEU|nr:sigma-70 family RNA polymerase sigma factor [Amycolatopsis taiwanensis]GLY68384.1 hypothetical protein Atai01_50030 [Amycolatopsis taiwanensis]
MSTVPTGFDGQSDAELITSVRTGTLAAYGTLYERHVSAAYNLARRLARSNVESDDLVSEAFAKVLDILRSGKGPDSAFRAYLLATLRHTAYAKNRKDRWVYLNEDMTTVSRAGGAAADALTVQFSDTAVAGLERTLVAKAFSRLPERWQAVLWHTEIEQQPPAEVSLVLGLSPNGVSALAHRAREGLRQAYLQVHLAETPTKRCRATAERLGAWTRHGLAKRERAQVEAHLDECAQCRALAAELADVNGALRAVVAPIVLGDAAFGYLTTTGDRSTTGDLATTGADGEAAGTGAATDRQTGSRQVVAVAVAGGAIAAAVAAALAMSGSSPSIPTALRPQPAQQLPAPELPLPAIPPSVPLPLPPIGGGQVPPAQVVPSPELPQRAAPSQLSPSPSSTSQQPSPPPTSAPWTEPQPPSSQFSPAQSPGASTPPARAPRLTVQGPPSGIELTAGGSPAELSITVHNDGDAASEPVTVALHLPDGLHTVGAGRQPLAQEGGGPVAVDCSGSQGSSASCRTDRGLSPGQTVVITFRLAAAPDAHSGAVTGTISAGDGIRVPVSVPVSVDTPPDSLELGVDVAPASSSPQLLWLDINVRNDGAASAPVSVAIDRPARPAPGNPPATCAGSGGDTSCTARDRLSPEGQLHLRFQLDAAPGGTPVKVTAKLGSATAARTLPLSPPAQVPSS